MSQKKVLKELNLTEAVIAPEVTSVLQVAPLVDENEAAKVTFADGRAVRVSDVICAGASPRVLGLALDRILKSSYFQPATAHPFSHSYRAINLGRNARFGMSSYGEMALKILYRGTDNPMFILKSQVDDKLAPESYEDVHYFARLGIGALRQFFVPAPGIWGASINSSGHTQIEGVSTHKYQLNNFPHSRQMCFGAIGDPFLTGGIRPYAYVPQAAQRIFYDYGVYAIFPYEMEAGEIEENWSLMLAEIESKKALLSGVSYTARSELLQMLYRQHFNSLQV